MKLSAGLTAALAGIVAAASSQPAEVYLLHGRDQSSTQSTSPSLPRQLARLILLQRLHADGRAGSLKDLPPSTSEEDAITYLNKFGKPTRPLFADSAPRPAQLVVLLEGITAENTKVLGDVIPNWKPSFTVGDVPSSAAHRAFIQGELPEQDMSSLGCSFEQTLNPVDGSCTKHVNRVARYDVQQV